MSEIVIGAKSEDPEQSKSAISEHAQELDGS